jgi:hypothetical protein
MGARHAAPDMRCLVNLVSHPTPPSACIVKMRLHFLMRLCEGADEMEMALNSAACRLP